MYFFHPLVIAAILFKTLITAFIFFHSNNENAICERDSTTCTKDQNWTENREWSEKKLKAIWNLMMRNKTSLKRWHFSSCHHHWIANTWYFLSFLVFYVFFLCFLRRMPLNVVERKRVEFYVLLRGFSTRFSFFHPLDICLFDYCTQFNIKRKIYFSTCQMFIQ